MIKVATWNICLGLKNKKESVKRLIIENNIQARSDFAESSKTGLENLQARYSFFTERKVVISDNGNIFKVALPLIIRK